MIDKAKLYERDELKRYWKSAFPEAQGESIDSYFNVYYKEEDTVVLRNNTGEIVASAQVRPKVLNLGGKKLRVSYISNVMTRPEFQGKGYMTKLLKGILKETSRDNIITLLKPFEPQVFRRLGFENVIELMEYNIPSSKIPLFNMDGIVLSPSNENLLEVYQKFTQYFDGYFQRDLEYYESLRTYLNYKKGNVIALKEGDDTIGYCVYLNHATHVEILECAYDTSGTLIKLMSFVARGKNRVLLKASTQEKIHKLFPQVIKSKQPFLMAYINDKALFERLYDIRILSAYSAFNISEKPKFNRDFQ